ncbi:hypothetical protein [Magnetospira sp. QH-2]|uniref:hypothetical protein n=1 Tax=Magnetospira sp. (strain QH-2) TaxID=1288970 RepID=UPI0005FA78EE|nr:hypothetical protein [Magnetospira sp. QH-2]
MKVAFTLPVTGTLRVQKDEPIQLYDWSFYFMADETTGFVNSLVIELSNIPKEKWPTLVTVEQDPNADIPQFPFSVNPDAFHFQMIEQQIINLESYLSVYGLEEIQFRHIDVRWISEEGDDLDEGLFAGFSMPPSEPESRYDPLNHLFLVKCIVASNSTGPEAAALAHYRVGASHYNNRRYIEAIRNLYLCIETLFANGKSKRDATLSEFRKSAILKNAIQGELLNSPSKSLAIILEKYPKISDHPGTEGILRFIYNLRGLVQHANGFTKGQWHPSRQQDFEHEAISLINIVDAICWQIAERDISSIKPKEPDPG